MPTTRSFARETIHTLLSNRRRRYLLYHFLENDYGNVTEVALQIAAWEEDTSIADVSDELYQRIEISLAHNHLPRLADHDLIEYDARSGDIVVRDEYDHFRTVIEQKNLLEGTTLDSAAPESSLV